MIRNLLALDGVLASCRFQGDGEISEGVGMLPDSEMERLAKFACDYLSMLHGNLDQLSVFTQMQGWTPPRGWMVHGAENSVCCVGNVVCVVENKETSLNLLYEELVNTSRY